MSRWFRNFFAVCALVVSVHAAPEEEVVALYLDQEPPGYEMPLLLAFEEDVAAWRQRADAAPALDERAAALERGEWLRAYAEARSVAEADDAALVARGRAREAWLLARLGLPHVAVERANEALAEPTARGETMLARAWVLWQAGAFEFADKQAAAAAIGPHAAPAWALAEWKKLRAARAKAAMAFLAVSEPEDVTSPAFLDHADRARAAGAWNHAAALYARAIGPLQEQETAQPGTARGLLERAVNGVREAVVGSLGGRLPGVEYTGLRRVVLVTARQVAIAGRQRAMWETYFKFVAEAAVERGGLDFAELDVVGDLATAEREAGVGPEWRERLRPLIGDARLRFASRLQQAIARVENDPAFGLDPRVDEPKPLAALVELVAREEAEAQRLRAEVPAEAAPVPQEREFAQVAAVTRLRDALARRDRAAAEAQLALVRDDTRLTIDAGAYRTALAESVRPEFREALAALEPFTLAELPADKLAHVVACAERMEAWLRERYRADFDRPEAMEAADAENRLRLVEVEVLVAARQGRILKAEAVLETLERWAKLVPGYAGLEGAQVTVLEMEATPEPLTPDEQAIAAAIERGETSDEMVKPLRDLARSDFYRLASRLLLARLHWTLCQDREAAEVIAKLRQQVRVNEAFGAQLDRLEAENDTTKICTALVDRLRATEPARRVAVAREAERELGRQLERYHRRFNDGKPIPPDKNIGMAMFAYRHVLASIGCTQAAQGGLRGAVDMLDIVTQDTAEMLRDFVVEVPFGNDLPNATFVQAWRELLADRELSVPTLSALHEGFRPHYGRSLTADLALAVLLIRNREFERAKEAVAKLRERYGINRAYAAQLGELDRLIAAKTEVVLLFESSAAALREREVLRGDLDRYVGANIETLRETYRNDGESTETRQVDALEQRREALRNDANAIEARNEQKVNEADRSRARAQSRAFANLLELTR